MKENKLINWIRGYGIVRCLLIIVLIGMCIYVRLPQKQMRDECMETGTISDSHTGSLGKGNRARQEILFGQDIILRSIDIWFETFKDTVDTEYVTVSVLEKGTKEEVIKRRLKTADISSSGKTRVSFTGGAYLSGGQPYLVVVTGPKAEAGQTSPAVYLAAKIKAYRALYVGGERIQNRTLAMNCNYQVDDSYNCLGIFIAGILMLMLLFLPRWFLKRLGAVWGIGWSVFITNPLIIFYLTMQLYGIEQYAKREVFIYTTLLLILVQCIVYAVVGHKYVTLLLVNGIGLLLACASYQVGIFRSSPITPADLLFVKTALQVSDKYDIVWSHEQLRSFAFMAAYLLFVFLLGSYRPDKRGICYLLLERLKEWREQKKQQEQKKKAAFSIRKWFRRYYYGLGKAVVRIALLVVGFIGLGRLYSTNVLAENGIAISPWNRVTNCKEHGFYLDFFMNLHYLNMEKPEGYAKEEVERIVKAAPETEPKQISTSKQPHIIIVMNESLADYTLVDSEGNMTYNRDYLPFIHSLDNNVIKGKCYVSIYGSLTADSEFECLTGNSMAFLPMATAPYQQFIKGTTFSLPLYLKTLGYRTIAVHPCNPANWNRTNAYASMDFDEFLAKDDFENPEIIRQVSDDATYRKVEEQFEKKQPGESLFIMAVTMQNHGGYTEATEWENPIVAADGSYPMANEYLSSANISDEAYERLLNYFSSYDEPVLILMFGDHQPAIEEEFVSRTLGVTEAGYTFEQQQERYCTPYILWANYEIPTELNGITSANFLSNLVIEHAGLPNYQFGEYLSGIQEKIEAINAYGYMTKDGLWHSYEEENEYSRLIREYAIVEYGNFGEQDEGKMAEIFGMPLLD